MNFKLWNVSIHISSKNKEKERKTQLGWKQPAVILSRITVYKSDTGITNRESKRIYTCSISKKEASYLKEKHKMCTCLSTRWWEQPWECWTDDCICHCVICFPPTFPYKIDLLLCFIMFWDSGKSREDLDLLKRKIKQLVTTMQPQK